MGPLRRQTRVPASKLSLPLSYASIMGGMLTLIGISTNLIVNGFTEQAGLPGFALFDFFWVAAPVFIAGILVITFISFRLLPGNDLSSTGLSGGQYFFERQVLADSTLVDKSVGQNNLRHLESFFLVEVIRGGEVITPVRPDMLLKAEDILVFSGDAEKQTILDDVSGLTMIGEVSFTSQDKVQEVVVSPSSILVGKRGVFSGAI